MSTAGKSAKEMEDTTRKDGIKKKNINIKLKQTASSKSVEGTSYAKRFQDRRRIRVVAFGSSAVRKTPSELGPTTHDTNTNVNEASACDRREKRS